MVRSAATALQIERGTRPLAAYVQLKELIVHGRLSPGSPLVETDIADRFGVSRTPVRSALQRLHQEGLIAAAGDGRLFRYVVSPLTRADGQALYHVIAELDGLAAHDAASLSRPDRDRLVGSLRQINDELRARARRKPLDPGALYDLDHRFHHLYMEAAGSPRLRALYPGVESQEERYARVYFVTLLPDAVSTFAREHDAIVEAIARGDADAAQRAARANWRNASVRLGETIERLGERGSW